MNKDISPEERLLRLIRKDASSKDGPLKKDDLGPESKLKKPPVPRKGVSLKLSLSNIVSRIGSLNFYNLKSLNKILLILVILSFVYLAISFIFLRPSGFKKSTASAIEQKIKEVNRPMPEARPYSYYADEIKKRDLFRSAAFMPVNTAISREALPNELIKDLSLLGVVRGEKPQAIIEDRKTNKSYFLNIGDSIGELVLKSIQEGKVTLDYRGQKFDLFL
ncbi:MAG: type II secretion system protein N [Candidatus Omnitrophota bacterium]